MKWTDPSGELFGLGVILTGMLIGALIGGASYAIQAAITGNWSWGGFIGSILVGGGVFKAIDGIISVGGFLGGAISGGISGAASGLVGGIGSPIIYGQNIVKGAFKGAIMDAVSGAILGGVVKGIQAVKKGGTFWTGDGMTVDVVNYYEIDDTEMLKVNNPIEATDANLEEYVKQNFPDADLDNITDYSVQNLGEGRIAAANGSATYDSSSNSWFFSENSKLIVDPRAFMNAELLRTSIGHELVHVSQFKTLAINNIPHINTTQGHYSVIREKNAYEFASKIGDNTSFTDIYQVSEYINSIKTYPTYNNYVNWRKFSWTTEMVKQYK